VKLNEADSEEQGGHAFRVMDAYVKWFESEGEKGKRALAVLRLLGLFDRPASADCLAALLKAPAISGLTEALVGMSEAQRNLAFSRLEAAKLLTVNRDLAGSLLLLDSHPLIREYFAKRIREKQTIAWRAAHRRLYEHLCATTKEGEQPTLEDLQPLYQAVAHGYQAAMYQEACDEVYFARILRRKEDYSWRKFGAFGSELGAVACFFEQPWNSVSPALREADQAWLLNEAGYHLRALGRLTEALKPMQAGLAMRIKQEVWKSAAIIASNLSELELALGEVAEAVGDAERSVIYANRSGDAYRRIVARAKIGDILHQAGHRAEAEARFRESEALQAERQPHSPLLYSVLGFWYCDLLLREAERGAWQQILKSRVRRQRSELENDYRAVSERAAKMLKWTQAYSGTTSLWGAQRSTRRFCRARHSTLATPPSRTPWTASAVPATLSSSLTVFSPAHGCAVSSAHARIRRV